MTELETTPEFDGADVDGQEDYEDDGGFENDVDIGDDFQLRGRGRGVFRLVCYLYGLIDEYNTIIYLIQRTRAAA